VVGESDRLMLQVIVGCSFFFISVSVVGKLIVDFSLGVLVYFYFLFGVILEI